MDKPKSLTRERVANLLPHLKCGKGNRLTSEQMTEDEAKYISHLDSLYSYSELASILTGQYDVTKGMILVSAAEKVLIS